MSESDIRMRVVQLALGNPELVDALEAFQRMYEEKLGGAHAAALEKAARAFDGLCVDCQHGPVNPEHERCWHEAEAAKRIRALHSHPEDRYLPEDEVRRQATEALKQNMTGQWKLGVAALADALGANVDDALRASLHGVDLDATGAQTPEDPGPRGCDCTGAPHPEEPGCPGYTSPTTEGNPTGEALLTLQRQEAATARNPDTWTCISCGAELGRPHLEGCSFRSGEGSSHG